MAEDQRRAKLTRTIIDIWAAMLEVLDTRDLSGRMFMSTDKGVRKVRVNRVRSIDNKWRELPTLLLDATLPREEVLRLWFPNIVTTSLDVDMPFTHVRMVADAPIAAAKLAKDKTAAKARRKDVRRYVLKRWIETGRGETLVVCQKGYEGWLCGDGRWLPDHVYVVHFGAMAGLDAFKRVRLLISIGRPIPGPQETEELAGVLSRRQLDSGVTTYTSGAAWFPHRYGGIAMRDGSCLGIEQDYHPDPLVKSIRWQHHEAQVLQAIGRARGVNRTADLPLQVDVMDNVCLPVLVDEVVGFEPPLPIVDMLAEGVVLTSPQDIHAAWPEAFGSIPTAERFTSDFGDELTLDAIRQTTGEPGWQAFSYQWAGAGQRPRAGCYLPATVGTIGPWLAGRVAGERHLAKPAGA